jgi:hypothetical protein
VGIINVSGAPFKNDRCYLSPLGYCGTKITKEHFISRTILERVTTGTLRFEGAGHFFGGKQNIEIGIDDFWPRCYVTITTALCPPLILPPDLPFRPLKLSPQTA